MTCRDRFIQRLWLDGAMRRDPQGDEGGDCSLPAWSSIACSTRKSVSNSIKVVTQLCRTYELCLSPYLSLGLREKGLDCSLEWRHVSLFV